MCCPSFLYSLWQKCCQPSYLIKQHVVIVPHYCCWPGYPEGRAWARQEWRDGCGWHHPEERLLHRGAQSEETLTDRPEKGRKKVRGRIISKRTDSVYDNPSLCLGAHWFPHPLPLPTIMQTISKDVGFHEYSWIKRMNLINGWIPAAHSIFSALLSLHHLVRLKPACTYSSWKSPRQPSSHIAERPTSTPFLPAEEEDCSLIYESASTVRLSFNHKPVFVFAWCLNMWQEVLLLWQF